MGHGGQKHDLLCILNHLFVVLINLFYRSNFVFKSVEKDLFYTSIVLFSFVEYCFFIHCEYGIGLKVDVPSKSTS